MDSFPAATNSLHLHPLLFPSAPSKQKAHLPPKTLRFSTLSPPKASSSQSQSQSQSNPPPTTLIRIKTIAAGAVLLSSAASCLLSGRRRLSLALTEPNSSTITITSLPSLLHQKLEEGDDAEALSILRRLSAAQPAEPQWKLLAARLLHEMDQPAASRQLLDEILAADPLSFEALFQNSVLMERSGEGEAALEGLERALELARAEQREGAAREVRLIIAQIQYLRGKVEEALLIYEELGREDPKDCRPFFCQGVIYTLLDRNKEARERFARYNELSGKKAEVNAYLQTALSRVRLCGTGDSGI